MMGKKILVLDDNEDILETLALLLAEWGYEIRTYNSGERVFEKIRDFKPDLVLMDVMLGDLDGRLICRSIKENRLTLSLPVILISGTHTPAECMHLPGAPNNFVVKPFDMSYLLATIAKHLPS